MWEGIRRRLAPIVEAANSSSNVIPTVVAVSCGRRPRNVAVPLLWCLSHALMAKVARRENLVSAAAAAEQVAQSRASLTNSISSFFDGTESYARQAATARLQAVEEVAELRPLIKPVERLAAAVIRQHRDGAVAVQLARTSTRSAGEDRRDRQRRTTDAVVLCLVVLVIGVVVGVLILTA